MTENIKVIIVSIENLLFIKYIVLKTTIYDTYK